MADLFAIGDNPQHALQCFSWSRALIACSPRCLQHSRNDIGLPRTRVYHFMVEGASDGTTPDPCLTR